MKKKIEIVRDFDGVYYANYYDERGVINTRISDYHTNYSALKRIVKEETGCNLPNMCELTFKQYGRKQYAICYLEEV